MTTEKGTRNRDAVVNVMATAVIALAYTGLVAWAGGPAWAAVMTFGLTYCVVIRRGSR